MTVTTNNARVLLALDLVQKYSSVYFSIGQSDKWNTNDTPPEESANSTAISNPIAYVQVKVATLCRPLQQNEAVPSDAITWGNDTYVRVSQADAYTQGATYVYFESTLSKADVTTNDSVAFRASGVQVGLKVNSGVTSPVVKPTQVSDAGVLFSYANSAVATLDDDTSVKLGALYTMAPFDA